MTPAFTALSLRTTLALAASVCVLLGGCASIPGGPAPQPRLFHDALFAPASQRIDAADIFAMSPAMKHYLAADIAPQLRTKGRQLGLVDALYDKRQLMLEYDSSTTRNAAEAFDARSGNCLSLVIMTAAFAKEINLSVRYQIVPTDEAWTRSGDMYLSLGHVNLTLGKNESNVNLYRIENDPLTIDFLPAKDLRGIRMRPISEATVIAMFMNNRAAEALAADRIDDAYWWVREAIRQDSDYLSPYNTLGVIYQRHGQRDEAAQIFAYILERDAANIQAMANYVAVLSELGRTAEARALARKLELLEPNPPYAFFHRGVAALRSGDYRLARELFGKEVARASDNPEFHFYLALAYLGLGDAEAARNQLAKAIENSTTRSDRDLYAGKLERIRAATPR